MHPIPLVTGQVTHTLTEKMIQRQRSAKATKESPTQIMLQPLCTSTANTTFCPKRFPFQGDRPTYVGLPAPRLSYYLERRARFGGGGADLSPPPEPWLFLAPFPVLRLVSAVVLVAPALLLAGQLWVDALLRVTISPPLFMSSPIFMDSSAAFFSATWNSPRFFSMLTRPCLALPTACSASFSSP